jgi:hypothetical protein
VAVDSIEVPAGSVDAAVVSAAFAHLPKLELVYDFDVTRPV